MSAIYTQRSTCRACLGTLNLAPSLGDMHLNAFPFPDEPPIARAPIQPALCRSCGLVQLAHTVDRDLLFRTYWYRSSIQPAMVAALKNAVEDAISQVRFPVGGTFLSIGANDGTELTYAPHAAFCVAVDPATNLMPELARFADLRINEYFPVKRSPEIPPATIITSLACLYDVDDLGAFCEGINDWLADDGVWLLQVSYLPTTLGECNVGDFVHEHLSYFTLDALQRLVSEHGLYINEYKTNDVNGGSIRVSVRKGNAESVYFRDRVALDDLQRFAFDFQEWKTTLRTTLTDLHDQGKTVLGLGASTKWNGVLSLCDIGPDLLPAIADRDPRKKGRQTVTRIPIISEDEGRARRPDVYVVGIPQFLEALKEREAAFLERGGLFLVPYPQPHFVGARVEVAA